MMDTYRVSAPATDEDGDDGVFSIIISERSNDVTPEIEMHLMLAMAADRNNVSLRGPVTVTQIS